MKKQAVIILAHGSRNKQARESFVKMVSVLNKRSGSPVVPAFYSLGTPTLTDAAEDLASGGYSRIIIFPYFLFDGNHVQKDIPALVTELKGKHPGLDLQVLKSLEHEPMMLEIVFQRIWEFSGQGG